MDGFEHLYVPGEGERWSDEPPWGSFPEERCFPELFGMPYELALDEIRLGAILSGPVQ
jgi:hypothetical protein